MRNPEAIKLAVEKFSSKISTDGELKKAFQRGQDAITALQNGRRGIGVDLEVEVGGRLIILNDDNQPERTAMSYAQMMSVVKTRMIEKGQIQGFRTTERDVELITAQAVGVSRGLLNMEEDMGWAGYLTDLFLREAICE
jgi:hypothetical protein